MAGTDREHAQARRAAARRSRRTRPEGEPEDAVDGSPEPETGGDRLETVKQAAKAAATAAAVGAAVRAAQAIGGNGRRQKDGNPQPDGAESVPPSHEASAAGTPPAATAEPLQAAERDASEAEQGEPPDDEPERATASSDPAPPVPGASPAEAQEVLKSAREQLAGLLGKDPESVSALERTGSGWVVRLEVVELSRIPDSTDLLASYELTLDEDRNLVRYRRGGRYNRSQAGGEEAL